MDNGEKQRDTYRSQKAERLKKVKKQQQELPSQ